MTMNKNAGRTNVMGKAGGGIRHAGVIHPRAGDLTSHTKSA